MPKQVQCSVIILIPSIGTQASWNGFVSCRDGVLTNINHQLVTQYRATQREKNITEGRPIYAFESFAQALQRLEDNDIHVRCIVTTPKNEHRDHFLTELCRRYPNSTVTFSEDAHSVTVEGNADAYACWYWLELWARLRRFTTVEDFEVYLQRDQFHPLAEYGDYHNPRDRVSALTAWRRGYVTRRGKEPNSRYLLTGMGFVSLFRQKKLINGVQNAV